MVPFGFWVNEDINFPLMMIFSHPFHRLSIKLLLLLRKHFICHSLKYSVKNSTFFMFRQIVFYQLNFIVLYFTEYTHITDGKLGINNDFNFLSWWSTYVRSDSKSAWNYKKQHALAGMVKPTIFAQPSWAKVARTLICLSWAKKLKFDIARAEP